MISIVTPVCKSFKTEEQRQQGIPDSRRDYEEQLQRDKNGEQIMWDDAKGNPTKHSGGFFAFVKMENVLKSILLQKFVGQMKGLIHGRGM